MGADIHAYAEVRKGDRWQRARNLHPDAALDFQRDKLFHDRDYDLFGFLADIRNYSNVPVISKPRGMPDDVDLSDEQREDVFCGLYHSHSWLTLAELLAYDYDQMAENVDGERLPLGEVLGSAFFRMLDTMAELGHPTDVRMVFWFDS